MCRARSQVHCPVFAVKELGKFETEAAGGTGNNEDLRRADVSMEPSEVLYRTMAVVVVGLAFLCWLGSDASVKVGEPRANMVVME